MGVYGKYMMLTPGGNSSFLQCHILNSVKGILSFGLGHRIKEEEK